MDAAGGDTGDVRGRRLDPAVWVGKIISRSNAVFDRPKLDWFNAEYIRSYPADKLLPLVQQEWAKAGIQVQSADRAWLLSTIDLLKPRARNLKDFATSFRAFFSDEFENDPAALGKFLKDEAVRGLIVELGDRYAASPNGFSEQDTEKVLRDFAVEKKVKAGALINGARVALTGQGVAPSLFAVMVALGKARTVARFEKGRVIVGRRLSSGDSGPIFRNAASLAV